MQQPQEIEVWYVLPAIRKQLALTLITNFGLKQKKVASLLGIRESTVSQYIKEKRAREITFSEKVNNEIKKSASVIFKDSSKLVSEVQKICKVIKSERILCQIHKMHSKTPVNCEVCLK